MTLPAFADLDQFADRVPGGISVGDEARAQAALEDASALIRVHAEKTWVTDGVLDADVPDIIGTICMLAARRVMENPEALESQTQTLGDATESRAFGANSNDVYLTAAEKAMVRKAAGVRSGLWVMPTTRGYLETKPVMVLNGAPERTYPDASEYEIVEGGEPAVYNGDEP
jgi:hypothetical protein